MGAWLIELGGQDVALFLGIKFAGTIVVLGLLVYAYCFKQAFSWFLIIPIFFFQVALLWYITASFEFWG